MVAQSKVDLYWIPLGAGAGGTLVRWSGRIYEAFAATSGRRPRLDLYHSALVVSLNGTANAVEMAPVWAKTGDRGVVAEGAVGHQLLGRSRLFRYEVRSWPGGSIPDAAAAVDVVTVSTDAHIAYRVLDLVPDVPMVVWGRDEQRTGEMWNSNSLVSWLLVNAGVDMTEMEPPPGGRAPGWDAGVIAAQRNIG
ncbi:MAG: hypothetical protein OER95_00810 [Acidimicrobiia bacterium]|nr:hypothetical protein [Acidimicrobiia bacterium]